MKWQARRSQSFYADKDSQMNNVVSFTLLIASFDSNPMDRSTSRRQNCDKEHERWWHTAIWNTTKDVLLVRGKGDGRAFLSFILDAWDKIIRHFIAFQRGSRSFIRPSFGWLIGEVENESTFELWHIFEIQTQFRYVVFTVSLFLFQLEIFRDRSVTFKSRVRAIV